MEIIPDRLFLYTATQICVLIFKLDSSHNAMVSKVTRYVLYGFSKQYFSSVDTRRFNLHEIGQNVKKISDKQFATLMESHAFEKYNPNEEFSENFTDPITKITEHIKDTKYQIYSWWAVHTFFYINNQKFKQSPRKSLIC